MAIYYCQGCDRHVDNDYHPMEEDELCPECHLEKQDDLESRAYEISQIHAQWCVEKGFS